VLTGVRPVEFSVDIDNEMAISQIGVKDKEVVQWE
jgi:hypothetical protein